MILSYQFWSLAIGQQKLDYTFIGFWKKNVKINFRGRSREEAVDQRGGILYKDEQIKNMLELAEELKVKPPEIVESQ